MTKTFDGMVDGKHVEKWTLTEEERENIKKKMEELKNKKKSKKETRKPKKGK